MNAFNRAVAWVAGCFSILNVSPVAAGPISAEAMAALRAASPGQTVMIEGAALGELPKIAYDKTILPGAQYLISDDPEYIRVPEAVALREEVLPGRVRLYVYNVNGVKEPEKIPRKIAAVIENLGEGPLELITLRYASPAPSGNYFGIAKQGMRGLFGDAEAGGEMPAPRAVEPGEAIVIDPLSEDRVVTYDQLVHGFYEFTITQPARIHVVQTAPDRPAAEAALAIAEPLPPKSKSGAGRGLFLTSDYSITNPDGPIDTAAGAQMLVVADGKDDPWVIGRETSSGGYARLAGNYGLLYYVDLERSSRDGRGLALVTWNDRFGSQWCGGMAAVVEIDDGARPGGIVSLPSEQLVTKSLPEVVVLQVFPPVPEGETGRVRLTYTPPGASCLPTPIAFLPIDWPSE